MLSDLSLEDIEKMKKSDVLTVLAWWLCWFFGVLFFVCFLVSQLTSYAAQPEKAMIEDLAREFPSLVEPLIFERDRFLAFNLHEACARGLPAHRARSPVRLFSCL
jgi:hypothetical protein